MCFLKCFPIHRTIEWIGFRENLNRKPCFCYHANMDSNMDSNLIEPIQSLTHHHWLVLWNMTFFSIYWECHHPNCYSLHHFSEGLEDVGTTKQMRSGWGHMFGYVFDDHPSWDDCFPLGRCPDPSDPSRPDSSSWPGEAGGTALKAFFPPGAWCMVHAWNM